MRRHRLYGDRNSSVTGVLEGNFCARVKKQPGVVARREEYVRKRHFKERRVVLAARSESRRESWRDFLNFVLETLRRLELDS